MSPVERNWHDNFIEYMKFIVNHPNYRGMPKPFSESGTIQWVVFGNSGLGRDRFDWWDRKRQELGIPRVGHWRSMTARANHPNGSKPCQVCGRFLSINYVYPNSNTVRRINRVFALDPELAYGDFRTIEELVDMLLESFRTTEVLSGLRDVFEVPKTIPMKRRALITYILQECKSKLGPGVMSNCPDRFDGFHTYNACCRPDQDTGRHAENLARYGEDRRLYEYWADGDWKASAWLMKKMNSAGETAPCSICGETRRITADHLGPLSLGFSVGDEPILRPACRSCNSGRNNRMTLSDVRELIESEEEGVSVVSWHAAYIWEALKRLPVNDEEARIVSRLMRTNLHYVMIMLALIAKARQEDFLVRSFLHPEYAYYSIEFEGFDSPTGKYRRMVKTKGDRTEYHRNAKRYVRISLESLKRYLTKENRKFPRDHLDEVRSFADKAIELLESEKEREALRAVDGALRCFAAWAVNDYEGNART